MFQPKEAIQTVRPKRDKIICFASFLSCSTAEKASVKHAKPTEKYENSQNMVYRTARKRLCDFILFYSR